MDLLTNIKSKYHIKQIALFAGGFILSLLLGFTMMKFLGHYELFLESLVSVKRIASKRRGLLAHIRVPPLVHGITRTRPYFYNAWPDLYSSKELEALLSKSNAEKGVLPVIVRGKGTAKRSEWPVKIVLGNQEDEQRARKVLQEFMDVSGYICVWENAFFRIFILK